MTQGHLPTYITPEPANESISLRILPFNESTAVNTATIAKIPTLTPSSDKVVRNKFERNA